MINIYYMFKLVDISYSSLRKFKHWHFLMVIAIYAGVMIEQGYFVMRQNLL